MLEDELAEGQEEGEPTVRSDGVSAFASAVAMIGTEPVSVCVCESHRLCTDAITKLSQPESAFRLRDSERRECVINANGGGTIKSVIDLDRVHMTMLVSSLLGSVWAIGQPVCTIAHPAPAKWRAEGIEGYVALDRSWVMVKREHKQPLIDRLNHVLPQTVRAHAHRCTFLFPSCCLH